MPDQWIPPPDTTETQHNGTDHLAVNNTLLRCLLTLLALRTTARLYQRNGPCWPISKNLIVKKSPWTHLTEAATLQFIAANTSVPVPRVHCAFVHKNVAYIVMQRIQGVSLAGAWTSLSADQLSSVFKQLRAMLAEIRALPPPPDAGVQSCIGGSLRDSRIPHARPDFGPFASVREFHSWLREDLQAENRPEGDCSTDWDDIHAMMARQDGQWPAPVFTHGDLNPFNVIISDAKVVGIIDWEFSGWYPMYWEYTSAWYGNRIRKFWQDSLPNFLDEYPEDLKMDIIRQKYWGDLGSLGSHGTTCSSSCMSQRPALWRRLATTSCIGEPPHTSHGVRPDLQPRKHHTTFKNQSQASRNNHERHSYRSQPFPARKMADPTPHVGWVPEPNSGRGTASLLYSCLFTIFLCSWSALHLAVPPPRESRRALFARRLGRMCVAVLAPEFMSLTAIQQLYCAQALVRRVGSRQVMEPHEPFTLTHAFFLLMGGFRIETRTPSTHDGEPTLTTHIVRPEYLVHDVASPPSTTPPLPGITAQAIMDKSKGDWLFKGLACVQMLWLTAQLIGRAAQRLPTTTLELFTLTLALCTLASYAAWWHKPLGVSEPYILDLRLPDGKMWQVESARAGSLAEADAEIGQAGDAGRSVDGVCFFTGVVLVFGGCHLVGWNFEFPSAAELWLWRVGSVGCVVLPLGVMGILLGPQGPWLVGLVPLAAVYLVLRTYLFVEIFASLRSVPVGVYASVDWSMYLPHI